ncbi:MAG: hypothetical protein AAFZ18_37875 [Myxococcota bacterium]
MRNVLLLLLASALGACTDPPVITGNLDNMDAGQTDAAKAPEDTGTRVLSTAQLHSAVEETTGSSRVLRGWIGSHTVQTATSARHRLRGGFRPLSR